MLILTPSSKYEYENEKKIKKWKKLQINRVHLLQTQDLRVDQEKEPCIRLT